MPGSDSGMLSRMSLAVDLSFAPVTPDLRFDIYRGEDWLTTFAGDVQHGLRGRPRSLPSKYFYDARGSALFDEITELPEYYPTRTEIEILRACGGDIAERTRAVDLVELGSGSSAKTALLLEPLLAAGSLERYVPIDISESVVRHAAVELVERYPGLRVHAVIGDFERHLGGLPAGDARLVAFLGGTIGNFTREQMNIFIRRVSGLLDQRDRLLIGIDLVKDTDALEAAYNDRAGVTARFNKNILLAVNTNLHGDFLLDAFDHVAFFDVDRSWIEMRLRSRCDQRVRIRSIDLEIDLAAGEEVRTEISRKFTRAGFERETTLAGMSLEEWYTDPRERFALALLAPG